PSRTGARAPDPASPVSRSHATRTRAPAGRSRGGWRARATGRRPPSPCRGDCRAGSADRRCTASGAAGPRGVASPWMTRRTLEEVEIRVTARAEPVACGGGMDDARRPLTMQLGDDAHRPLEPGVRVDREDLLLGALDVALEKIDPRLAGLGEQRRQVDG